MRIYKIYGSKNDANGMVKWLNFNLQEIFILEEKAYKYELQVRKSVSWLTWYSSQNKKCLNVSEIV